MSEQQGRVRVVIADARGDVREALAVLLEASDDFEVVGQAATPAEAAERAAGLAPDLLVVDPCGMTDIQALRRLAALSCSIVLLPLTISPECRVRARELGVAAVLDKSTSPEEVLHTLRSVAGRTAAPPQPSPF